MNKLFSKKIANTKRQLELDLARGLAIFFMILVHVQGNYSLITLQKSSFGFIIDILGGILTAPVFMLVLGVGIIFSKKSEPKLLLKKGLIIFCLGYLLNLLREVIPNYLFWKITRDYEYFTYGVESFILVDIFQFAGLALIFFGIMKYFNIKKIS